jgi:hypothetical protein
VARTLTRNSRGIPQFEEHWQVYGACTDADPEVMFPSDSKPKQIEAAKAVCMGCPFEVREKCLDENMDTAYGVFGAKTADERKALSLGRRRRAAHTIVRRSAA